MKKFTETVQSLRAVYNAKQHNKEVLSQLTSLAVDMTKAKKGDARVAIESLARQFGEDEQVMKKLAMLFKFVEPIKPSTPKNSLQWVDKAVAKKGDPRPYFYYSYSDGINYMASDGTRVLRAKNIGLEKGYYIEGVLAKTVDEMEEIVGQFPSERIGKILSTSNIESALDARVTNETQILSGANNLHVTKIQAISDESQFVWVQTKNLDISLSFKDDMKVKVSALDSWVFLYKDELDAVLMGTRVK